MWFSRKQGKPAAVAEPVGQVNTKHRGDAAEQWARRHLQEQGLAWVASNFRTPGRGGGEIDLIMRERDGTLVFVEVRQRSRRDFGGAGASVGALKRQRLVLAARHYLLRLPSPPPCRFDVLLIDGALNADTPPAVTWLRGAFDET